VKSAPLPSAPRPAIVAVEMGYGHLRPAHALADLLGGEVHKADEPPLAGPNEQRTWARTRFHYETLTRLSQLPRSRRRAQARRRGRRYAAAATPCD